jgi:NAD+ kinase
MDCKRTEVVAATPDKPIRAVLCGRHLDDLRALLRDLPIVEVAQDPDVVISHGGDGSLLGAERDWPRVPKCPLRDRRMNPKCPAHPDERVLELLVRGELKMARVDKLVARMNDGRELIALNDLSMSKGIVTSSVRYRLWLDDELYKGQIVGDGLVVATPFGSTGYFRNITQSLFRVGIGLAFNNCSDQVNHIVVGNRTVIRAKVLRGPAMLVADNDPARLDLAEGDEVTIAQGEHQATILGLDIFRCRECYSLRENGV